MKIVTHPLSMTSNICLIVDSSQDLYDRKLIKGNNGLSAWKHILPDDWTLYVTDYTFAGFKRIGTVNLYSKLYYGIEN